MENGVYEGAEAGFRDVSNQVQKLGGDSRNGDEEREELKGR